MALPACEARSSTFPPCSPRALEASAGPLGPGLTLSSYRDAFHAHPLDRAAFTLDGPCATRSLAKFRPRGGTAGFGGPLGRPTEFPPIPRTRPLPAAGASGFDAAQLGGAAPFYARTTYRDAFGDPYGAPVGELLGLAVTTGADGSARAAPRPPPAPRRPPTKPIELKTGTVKRSISYSRTTYMDGYGVPFPVGAAREEGGRPETATRTRGRGFAETRDPRWERVPDNF
jgi:hypothetical protein